MKLFKISYRLFFLALIGIFSFIDGHSQTIHNTTIQGTVIDAETRANLPFVSVILENTTIGTVTDENGRYNISTSKTAYKITFSFLGYESESRIITPGKRQVINVELTPSSEQLREVVVKPVKKKYSNKNNPAVELIEKVIQNKGSNRRERLPSLSYEKYEKIVFALSNISDKFEKMAVFSKYNFIFNNVDSSRIEGKDDLPLFIKEKVSDCIYRKNPKFEKEVIKAEKTVNLSEYIDIKGLSADLNYLYQNIDIYENDIFFMSNRFLSPVAPSAPMLYRYFIIDTSLVNNVRCIKLFFEPRNPSDFLFHGFLSITDDSHYAIRRIDMSFNKHINIDWIKDARIIQDFEEIDNKTWLLSQDEISIEFGVTQNLPGLIGHRIVSYSDFSTEPIADESFKGPSVVLNKDASDKSTAYWETVRKPPLSPKENQIYSVIDSVKKVPAFRREMNLIMLLTTDYLNLGKVEIGPVNAFYSFNPVEGSRIRFGGRTTPEFNKNIYLQGYAAYGFFDKKLKYNLTATYSLTGTSIYTFPVKSLKFNYLYDTSIPGQELIYNPSDNFFYSFRRGINDKMFYNRTYKFEFLNEYENHFSYMLGFQTTKLSPGGNLYFNRYNGSFLPEEVPFIRISETYMTLRYAPREQFYQGKEIRYQVPSKYPTLQFNYTIGSKRIGNDYNYQKFQFSISKRFYFSIIGYTDVSAEAGKILGKVSYPLLFIHNANQTYSYQSNAYNMMNFLEFVSDHYFSLNIDHSFNGFFFNKIPLLKKLKLREVATLKAIYGGIRQTNNPELQPDLLKFPADAAGIPLTYTLDRKPYIEGSVGVSNIFKVLRVDVIKRFAYLGNPNVAQIGIRFQIRFDI